MSDPNAVRPLSIKLPREFFSMSEKEQREWVTKHLKRSAGIDYVSTPNKEQEK